MSERYEDSEEFAALVAMAEDDEERPESEYCHHCGKAFDEWGDMGCEFCDRRHPGFGILP